MKLFLSLALIVFASYSFVCNEPQGVYQVIIKNQTNISVEDAYVEFNLENLKGNLSINDGSYWIPYQIERNESGGNKVCVILGLKPHEEKVLSIIYGDSVINNQFKARTYAELAMKPGDVYYDGKFRGNSFVKVTKLKVPLIHTDHDALFKYEGPGWESEKVGYRIYLDWRNAIDIFGKKKDQLVLVNVGVHDTVAKDDSYHNMQEWGMDIFKVGNSLGIGSFGMWHNGKVNMVSKTDSIFYEIDENGPLKSRVKLNYYGWKVGDKKYDLQSKLSITSGSRLTKNELSVSDENVTLVTGLAKYPGTQFFKSEMGGEWSYIALFGNQTLVSDNDKLGIALFYRTENYDQLTEDDLSYIIKFKTVNRKVEYYFCAAWEQEQYAIKNISEFTTYLNETQMLLNNPPTLNVKK